jgi:hypothetical protein
MVSVLAYGSVSATPISIAFLVTPGAVLQSTLWNYSSIPTFVSDSNTIWYLNNTGAADTVRWSYMVTLLC